MRARIVFGICQLSAALVTAAATAGALAGPASAADAYPCAAPTKPDLERRLLPPQGLWYGLGQAVNVRVGDQRCQLQPESAGHGTDLAMFRKMRRARESVAAFETALAATQGVHHNR